MGPKSTHWIPTERSPWAVIVFRDNEWRFLEVYFIRKHARDLKATMIKQGVKARVVRAWIPLR